MKKILIVDDTRFMRKAASAMLASQYETVCASSGEEALELIEREKPDLVLTDLQMQGMSGLELLEQLKQRSQDHVPVMFMTAAGDEESESRVLRSGAIDCIRKPFHQELLLLRVENIMRQLNRIAGLKMVAEADPMTGMLNKVSVQKALRELCRHAAGTLMMIDLDSFKLVNDLYGHNMGDRVLIRFSEIIRSVIRSSDVAGRVGGDEFIVFCKDVRDEDIIAERTRQLNESLVASAKEFMGEDCPIPLGASVGAVRVPDEGTEFTALYQKADKALYQVKQHGRHGYEIYHGESAAAGEGVNQDVHSSIEGIRMILDERNRQKGAYALSGDHFLTVYRYAVRALENYQKTLCLALFSLHALSGVHESEAVERFGEVLGASLRRSDVFTKNGRNQYIAILTEADDEGRDVALSRVQENWTEMGGDLILEVHCETIIIAP